MHATSAEHAIRVCVVTNDEAEIPSSEKWKWKWRFHIFPCMNDFKQKIKLMTYSIIFHFKKMLEYVMSFGFCIKPFNWEENKMSARWKWQVELIF